MNQQASKYKYVPALLACIVLLAGILRCWNINQSFWWDEIWSTMAYAKTASIWTVISSLGYYFNNHIFYSVLARFSMQCFGESEIAARLPALVMGLLGILVLFYCGKKFLGDRTGIVSALLLAISAFHIDHSTEARGYSGLALFSLLSSLFFLLGLRMKGMKIWIWYVVFTVLGCYTHTFMVAICIAQVACVVLFFLSGQIGFSRIGISQLALRSFLLSLGCAAIITLILYAAVLPAFLTNMGKVRYVHVNRMPFIINLLSALTPGVAGLLGGIVYGIICVAGIGGILKKDPVLGVYIAVLLVLPLALYLALNPMFVFERYFIYALPFVLMVMGHGIMVLSQPMQGLYKIGFILGCLLLIVYMQMPSLYTMLTQDRQNYREAMLYVEKTGINNNEDLVFSIGYAGENFQYYSRRSKIILPQTLNDLNVLSKGKKRIWCLISAWLPEIRPAYEDQALYSEKYGQSEIYDLIKKRFQLKKYYPSRFPVEIYYLEQ